MTTKEKISSVKAVYDNNAESFSQTRNYIWPDLKPFLKQVRLKSSVLDVGCGNGRLLLGLPKSVKYTGLDISPKLLKEAEKKFPDQSFIETDVTKTDIWKHLGMFDHIYCVALMHHLPDKETQEFVLKQIKEHLKPKGTLLITAWNLWQPKYLKYHIDLATKWRNPYWVNKPFFNGEPRFLFAYTKPYLENLLRDTQLPLKIKKTDSNYLLHS